MGYLNRRDFVRASLAGFGAAIVSSGLTGCLDEANEVSVSFDHGVASGDPLSDRVIIWTKVTTEADAAVDVRWRVYEVETGRLVVDDVAYITAATGHTVKVDATGLLPDTAYRYEFSSNGVTSDVGYTRTLPEGAVSSAKFAVVSCSNYPAGYFHVYASIAALTGLNAVLHLGDYIYEYGSDGYATEQAEALGRTLAEGNDTEIFTLADYRNRYALYRTDVDLQACHAAHPFIAVWDDHEVANDAYKNGAENHNDGEGDYETRKLYALQAYFEWMPIRVTDAANEYRAYRRFQFGDLLDLYMLDTRIEGRDVQLDYADFMVNGAMDADALTVALSDSARTMLGDTQLNWLSTEMASSTATWQFLGQQVLMGRMLLPAAIATQAMSIETYALVAQTALLAARAQAGDPTLTTDELAFLSANQSVLTDENVALVQLPSIPYNLDAWDGYGYEREVLLNTAKSLAKNLVVLAGDTHNAWANNLKTLAGDAVGVEFATASVSSPGLETYLGISEEAAAATEAGIVSLVDGLEYLNSYDRGYLLVEATPSQVSAEWQFVTSIYERSFSVNEARSHRLTVSADTSGVQIA